MLEIGRGLKKARVWSDSIPDLRYPVMEWVERVVAAQSRGRSTSRCVAVELWLVTGPRALYGLLGAEFIPDSSEQLRVQVALSATPQYNLGMRIGAEEGIAWSLAVWTDDVRIGLPEEYVRGIWDGIAEAGTVLGSGTLTFQWAAHGAIGSSQALFGRITRCLVQLLAVDAAALSQEELAKILQL